MKKTLVIILALLLGFAANAVADVIELQKGDSYYVGTWKPDNPADDRSETSYLNYLITLSPGDADIYNTVLTETFNRVASSLTTLPSPGSVISKIEYEYDPDPAPVSFGGGYIMGKYDADRAGALVWYIDPMLAGNNSFDLPRYFDGNQFNISHTTYWSSVPEPTSLLLLGLGLIGLGAVTRKKIKK